MAKTAACRYAHFVLIMRLINSEQDISFVKQSNTATNVIKILSEQQQCNYESFWQQKEIN